MLRILQYWMLVVIVNIGFAYDYSGTLKDQNSNPLGGFEFYLNGNGQADTTDAQGNWTLQEMTVGIVDRLQPSILFINNHLLFNNMKGQTIELTIYSSIGAEVGAYHHPIVSSSRHQVQLPGMNVNGIFFLKVKTNTTTQQYQIRHQEGQFTARVLKALIPPPLDFILVKKSDQIIDTIFLFSEDSVIQHEIDVHQFSFNILDSTLFPFDSMGVNISASHMSVTEPLVEWNQPQYSEGTIYTQSTPSNVDYTLKVYTLSSGGEVHTIATKIYSSNTSLTNDFGDIQAGNALPYLSVNSLDTIVFGDSLLLEVDAIDTLGLIGTQLTQEYSINLGPWIPMSGDSAYHTPVDTGDLVWSVRVQDEDQNVIIQSDSIFVQEDTNSSIDSFYRINILEMDTTLPNIVNVLFQAKDDKFKGQTHLEDCYPLVCNILVDGAALTSESSVTISRPNIFNDTVYTVLLLDNSSSLQSSGLNSLKSSAIEFVRQKADNQWISIYSFASTTYLESSFSNDTTALINAINAIGLASSSTNLYGALLTGIGDLRDETSITDKNLIRSNLVVFTDGKDTQGSNTLAQVISASQGKEIFAVGSGNEFEPDTLDLITNGKTYHASDFNELSLKFEEMQADLLSEINSVYYLHYNSPKRGNNQHLLELYINGNTNTDWDALDSAYFNSAQFADGFAAEAIDVQITAANDSLYVSYNYSDYENDTEGKPRIRWRINSYPQNSYDSLFAIPLTDVNEGTYYEVIVTPRQKYKTPILGVSGADTITMDAAPVADSLWIEGKTTVDSVLTARYQYSDAEVDIEGASLFRWFKDSVEIIGATQSTYTILPEDWGTNIYFEVTPVSATGFNRTGSPVTSDFVKIYDFIIDSRDSQEYKITTIGKQEWFAENLRYLPQVDSYNGHPESVPRYAIQGHTPANGTEESQIQAAKLLDKYQLGVHYNWYAATELPPESFGSSDSTIVQGACPVGWHIPSKEEWFELFEYLRETHNTDAVGPWSWPDIAYYLKSTHSWEDEYEPPYPLITNGNGQYGFNVLPLGHANDFGSSTGYLSSASFFGSSVSYNGVGYYFNTFHFSVLNNDLAYSTSSKPSEKLNVRCIKDKPFVFRVSIDGTPKLDSVLNVSYGFADSSDYPEGASIIQWYRDTAEIAGANSSNYTLTSDDIGHKIIVGITPVSSDDSSTVGKEEFDTLYVYDTFIDVRDNKEYKKIDIGNQTWMAEDLAYMEKVYYYYQGSEDVGYEDTLFTYLYGYNPTGADMSEHVTNAKLDTNYANNRVLYNGLAALNGDAPSSTNPSGIRGICPLGWHLPSKSEWQELFDFVNPSADTTTALKLKQRDFDTFVDKATDDFLFSQNPNGYRKTNGNFDYGVDESDKRSILWASDVNVDSNQGSVVFRKNKSYTSIGDNSQELGASVRCVKN